VPLAISPVPTSNEASGVTESLHLSPGIQGKIFTIPFTRTLKFFRRHPEVGTPELFLVGDITALPEEAPKIFQALAFDRKRLREIATDRKRRWKAIPLPLVRPKRRPALRVISFRENFSDHRVFVSIQP
jgi:hypothetical protein